MGSEATLFSLLLRRFPRNSLNSSPVADSDDINPLVFSSNSSLKKLFCKEIQLFFSPPSVRFILIFSWNSLSFSLLHYVSATSGYNFCSSIIQFFVSPVKGGGGSNEAYSRLLRHELLGSDFVFSSPAGGTEGLGSYSLPVCSPNRNMLRFKPDSSGQNSPYSGSILGEDSGFGVECSTPPKPPCKVSKTPTRSIFIFKTELKEMIVECFSKLSLSSEICTLREKTNSIYF